MKKICEKKNKRAKHPMRHPPLVIDFLYPLCYVGIDKTSPKNETTIKLLVQWLFHHYGYFLKLIYENCFLNC